MTVRPPDTSERAHALQVRLYCAMRPEERLELALRMSDDIRQVAVEGIKQRHPNYSDRETQRALVALLYGSDAASSIWPDEPVPQP